MNIYYLILLAVSCLGLRDDINFDRIHENFEQIEKSSSVYGAVRSKYGDVPLGDHYVAPNKDAGVLFREKYNLGLSGDLENYKRGLNNYHYNIDDGNPDIHGYIERPCQVYDTFCIRTFFAEHSKCKISGRAVPEPFFRAQLTVNYPHVNMSATQRNLLYSGLNDGRIEEFYINRATDNLIISINFPAVTTLSNQTALKFYRKGREPAVNRGPGNAMAFDCLVTVIIPYLKNLRLDRAAIYTYANSPLFLFTVGPELALNTDPEVLLMLTEFLTTVRLDNPEAALTETNFYATNFIQYNICDFGLKII